MVIVALIREVKATLRNGIYYYKNFGVDEVVDLSVLLEEYGTETSGLSLIGATMWTFRWTRTISD